ncbi:hypothetical protein N7G274_006620 [Stereocaulon virgatum]|uniref:Uncharacterized protein n=1 Tax=Stereocaulon virgatum TaxID=373712 RepID=A0ABR4A6X1_9LECA
MIEQWRGINAPQPAPSTSEARFQSEGSKAQYPKWTRGPIGVDHPQNQTLGQGSSDVQSPLSCRLQHGNLEDTEGPITDYFDSHNAISGRVNVTRLQPYENRYLK